MSEFPRRELLELARKMEEYASPYYRDDAALIRLGIQRFDELAERCVMDRTRDSAEIGRLRAAMQEALDNWTALVAKIRRGEL